MACFACIFNSELSTLNPQEIKNNSLGLGFSTTALVHRETLAQGFLLHEVVILYICLLISSILNTAVYIINPLVVTTKQPRPSNFSFI